MIMQLYKCKSGENLAVFQAYIDKEDSKKLKQKQREKMQPKMGKMDIDYQVSPGWCSLCTLAVMFSLYPTHTKWVSCFFVGFTRCLFQVSN